MATLKKMTRVGADVRQIARLLQAKAPENHLLAYITPEEAELLKSRGGSGMPDPQTGIPTYYVPDPEYVDPDALLYMQQPMNSNVTDVPDIATSGATTAPSPTTIDLLPQADFSGGGSYYDVNRNQPAAYGQPSAFSSFQQQTAPTYYMGGSPSAYGQSGAYSSFDQQSAQTTQPSYYMGGSPSAYAKYPASEGEVPVEIRDVPAPPIDTTPSKTIGERYSDLAKSLGVKEDTLSRIGLAGLQVGLGARQARLAREEAKKPEKNNKDLPLLTKQKVQNYSVKHKLESLPLRQGSSCKQCKRRPHKPHPHVVALAHNKLRQEQKLSEVSYYNNNMTTD